MEPACTDSDEGPEVGRLRSYCLDTVALVEGLSSVVAGSASSSELPGLF